MSSICRPKYYIPNMVSHYDCAKQHNLRQFNLLNVKQCTEAPEALKCETSTEVKYRRVDRNV